ncbi:hypothetical protein GCM10009060_00120 [Halorubrum trapanicum]
MILFGFLIVALGVYQVQVVPTENADVEFEHSQSVEDDFGDLRNDVLRAGSTGSTGSTQIRLGTRYPARTFFVNPPPVSGSIETEETGAIRVRNATVGAGSHPNVAAFWNTSPAFSTRSLRYEAGYNEFDGAPRLTYEHSLVAAEFDDSVLLRSGQTVVSDDRISLTALRGSVSETGITPRSVDARAVSASDTTVPLEPTGGNVTLELPTAVENASLLADRWTDALPASATATPNATGEAIRVTLANGSDPYRLALSEVSLDASGDTEPAYVVPVGSETAAVGERVGVEVRDRYNNPVPDADVSIAGDGRVNTTNGDGRVFFEANRTSLTATINGTAGPVYESVTFDVTDGGGGGSARTFDVEWEEDSPIRVEEQGNSPTLSISVSDTDSGNPIENADVDVSFGPKSANPGVPDVGDASPTDSDGLTTVTFDPSAANAGDEFYLYAAAGDDVDRIPVVIVPPSSIGGTVTDAETGSPLDGAAITVYEGDSTDPADEVRSTTTTADGSYSINVEPGQYTVEASEDGYSAETTLTDVAPEESVENVDFALSPVASPELYPDAVSVTAGTIDNFGNLQNENAQVTTLSQPGTGQSPPFDITTTTENVPSGTYSLELGVVGVNQQGNSGGIDVTVTDESGTVLGSTTLTAADEGTTVTVPLDTTTSVQDISVQYAANRRDDTLDLDFQRLVE